MSKEYIETLRYFVKNNECLESGEMCPNCPITETCNTPTDVEDAKKWLRKLEDKDENRSSK